MTTYADIVSLIESSGSTTIDLSDNLATLTTAQAQSLIALGVVFAANDEISIADGAETIEALTATDIAKLKTLGASQVLANDRALALDIAQIHAFAAADIAASSEYATMSATTSSDVLVGSALYSSIKGMTPVALADGSYVVMYKAPTSPQQLVVQALDASGNATGTVVVAVDTNTTFTDQASIDALAGGGYVVVWQFGLNTLRANRYSADGELIGSATLDTSEYQPLNSSVVGLSDGGFIVTFKEYVSATGWHLMTQRYDADGNAVGDTLTLTNNNVYSASTDDGVVAAQIVELADGKLMVIWTDTAGADGSAWGLFGQIIDSDGTKVGSAVAINSSTAGDQYRPSVTELSEGGFAVAWYNESNNGIYVQVFDEQGNKVNSEILVNAHNYAQDQPKIVALDNGNFVVTWTWDGVDNPGSTGGQHEGVYSQVIDAAGNKVGPVSLVNTTVVGSQMDPEIVALKDGGYVIVWLEKIDANGDGYEVNGQLFDAKGNKIGSEFEINVNESGSQLYQKVTALADGGFAVAWYDHSVGKYYTRVYHNDTDIASLKGTASAISALTAADAADLVEMHISAITVSDGGAVTLTKAASVALADISGLGIQGAASVTVSGTGAALAELSVSDIAKLDAMGVTGLDATNDVLELSLDQAKAYVSAGITLASGDVVTVTLSASALADLTASELLALSGIGVEGLDLTDNAASLTLARIAEIRTAGFAFAATDVITVADSQLYVGELTASEIADLAAWGVTRIDMTEGSSGDALILSFTQVEAFLTAGIVFTADSKVHVYGSVSDIAALDADDIADLAALGVDTVMASGTMPISVAQFEAYLDNGVVIDAGIEDVQLADSASNLQALSATRISHFVDFHIRLVNASDDSLALDMGQIYALRAVGASVHASDVLALSVTSATLSSLSAYDLSAAHDFGATLIESVTSLDATLETLARVATAGLKFATDLTARLSDTTANLLAASSSDIDAYTALGVDEIRLSDSASVIAGLTTANINTLDGLGVTTIDVTDNTISLSLAKATKFADLGMTFESSDTVIVTASASTFADPDLLDLAGLRSIHVDKIDVTDNALTLSLDRANTYLAAGIGFVSADTIIVELSLAEALALDATSGSALLAAGVDVLRIDLTPSEIKALTVNQIAALGAAGINAVDIEPDAVMLSAAQASAFLSAGISFAGDDDVTQHLAPTLTSDTATVKEGASATVAVLANDAAHDGLTLSLEGATVTSGDGAVTVNSDGSLTVRYTGVDIDGTENAVVTVTYTVSDSLQEATSTLVVTFTAITEDLIGTNGADNLTGGSAGEIIKGLGGSDVLDGAAGNDRIWGGNGNDQLIGGLGADDIYGGKGKDVFQFLATSQMGTARNATDTIFDFSQRQGDKIDFSGIDANIIIENDQDFTFIRTAKFHAVAGELRYERHGSTSYVYGDVNGDGKADFVLEIDGVTKLAGGDFQL